MTSTILLASLPSGLRDPLIEAFNEVCRNYTERRWEPSELNGGKLCEVVYTIVEGSLQGKYANTPCKPKDMVKACRGLEQLPEDKARVGDRSLRILIPRVLVALYEIRNNRGVGHVGGDVNANFMDATVVQSMCRWLMAEIIRVFHNVPTTEAQAAVDLLVERKLPIIWERQEIKRVLPKISYDDQILVLLYSESNWVSIAKLLAWTEYSNPSKFRRELLAKLHKARVVEYEGKLDRVCLTSAGVTDVESRLIPTLGKEYF